MADKDLVYNLVLETKQAVNDIKGFLDKTNNQASTQGKNAGKGFGANFKTALLGIVSGISFKAITSQIQNLFGLFQRFANANLQLEGAINAANAAEQRRNAVLNDSNATIEQKAMAIGLDTSEIYENTKATKTNEGAIKSLEKQIKDKERALEDETRALEANVSAIEEKRDLEIRSLREQRGFNTLTKEEQALEKEITELELQRLQAIKAGNTTQVTALDTILDQKRLDQDIAQKRLDLIDQETDKIEDLYKVQIEQLRVQMEASKNRFDIDIEPAKRKLEDLRATSISVGGGQVLKKGIKEQIEAAAKQAPKVLNAADFSNLQNTLFDKFKGIVPRDALTSAISDLVKGGLRDTAQIEDTITRFVDIAAAGKSPFVSMGEAVSQLGEQFRSERAALGETAGLTEEYISDILPRGLAVLQARGELQGKTVDNLTTEERALAKQAGLLEMTTDRQGLFNTKADEGLLAVDELRAEFEKIALVIANELGPKLLELAEYLIPIVQQITTWVSENHNFILALLGVATAFVGILTVVSAIMFVWPAIVAGFSVLGTILGVLLSPIGLVVLAIAAITAAVIWAYQNVEWFRILVDTVWNAVVITFNWAKDRIGEVLGKVWEFLKNLFNPSSWRRIAIDALVAVISYLTSISWGDIFSGIRTAFESMWNGIKEWFNNINWSEFFKQGANGIRDFIVGLLKGIAAGVPGAESVINPMLDKIPRFATGGEFMVGGRPGIDTNLVQFMATRGEKVIVQTPNQQRNQNINSNNNSEVTNIIYTSGNSIIPQFMNSF